MYKFGSDWTYMLSETLVGMYFEKQGYKVCKADKFLGYDLVLEKEDTVKYIEVKLDVKSYYTGNIFWEVEVDGDLGWALLPPSKPDVEIFWVFPTYFLSLPYQYVLAFDFSSFPKKEVVNKSLRREGNYLSYGHLVPLKSLPFKKHVYADFINRGT